QPPSTALDRTTALERGTLMTNLTAAPRLGRWKAASALVAAAALLAFAGSAGATVFTPTDGAQLQAAITSANSNPGADTIKLAAQGYTPSAPMTVTDAAGLVITGDPTVQGSLSTGFPTIDGGSVVPLQADMLTVSAGAKLTLKALTITSASDTSFAVIRNRGTLEVDNSALQGNNGAQIAASSGATTLVNSSDVSDGNDIGINNTSGTLRLFNST